MGYLKRDRFNEGVSPLNLSRFVSELMEIRDGRPKDFEAIRQVNIAAFERPGEADLVDRLRQAEPTFSFVAVQEGQVVGHIFFSEVAIAPPCTPSPKILGLAPLAVLPDFQRQGIGSSLVQHGLEVCSQEGFGVVVVLGHPEYYARFGFVTAKTKGLGCEYDVPDEVFMVVELQPDALKGCEGKIQYRPEFAML